MGTGEFTAEGSPVMDEHLIEEKGETGVSFGLVASWLVADFTYLPSANDVSLFRRVFLHLFIPLRLFTKYIFALITDLNISISR